MNYLHVAGILLRNIYLLRRSYYRAFSLFYWATVEIFLWGFITTWLNTISNPDIKINFVVTLIGALLFWDLFFRVQQAVSVAFLEDVWSRNILNIFASPVRPRELILGFIILSLVFGIISFTFVSVVASVLYALKIWTLGLYLVPFVVNLFIFGWALGFAILGFTIRFGPSFEILAWSIPVLFQPLSAVFYPVEILPAVLEKMAFFLPTMHLFEGMRSVLLRNHFSTEHILWATLLNLGYFSLGLLFFYWMVRVARKRGSMGRLVTD